MTTVPTLAADPWRPTPRFRDVDPWPSSPATSPAVVTDPLISSALRVVLRAREDRGAG